MSWRPICPRPKELPDLSLAAHEALCGGRGEPRRECGRCWEEARLALTDTLSHAGDECYRCWVECRLDDLGWHSWTKHPDWCSCELQH